jgi:cholesterol oxidase
MAHAPDKGVTNQHGEVFNYPGMYVTDGGSIPSSLAVPSSLTILANAERIAEGIVNRYTSREKIIVKKSRHE